MGFSPRILIVDDEPEVRTFFEQILSTDGYSVHSVATGRDALEAVRNYGFEILVIDLSLPDANGLELIRQIRSEMVHLHIVAISGFMVGEMPRVALASGASAALPKPTTARALRESILTLLQLHRGRICASAAGQF